MIMLFFFFEAGLWNQVFLIEVIFNWQFFKPTHRKKQPSLQSLWNFPSAMAMHKSSKAQQEQQKKMKLWEVFKK